MATASAEIPLDLSDWRSNVEKEAMDIVKTRLLAKLQLFEECWERFKSSRTCSLSSGFLSAVLPSDSAYVPLCRLDESDVRQTGPNGSIVHLHALGEAIEEYPGVEDALELLRTNTVDLQSMATSIRLHLSLIAPAKRSSDNLTASVQSEISERVDMAISFCQQFIGIIYQFNHSRGSMLSQIRENADSPDADQTLYEYDQAVAISLSRGFIELQYIFVYLSDLLDVRITSKIQNPIVFTS